MAFPMTEGAAPIRRSTFITMTIVFSITTVALLLIGVRLSQRGHWLPRPPVDIPGWQGAEKPLNRGALEQLGDPDSVGFEYSNVFGESVQVHIIATNSFESYLDPRTVMLRYRFGTTAQKEIPLFGRDGSVRGLVFRSPDSEARVVMYYWIQTREGKTNGSETLPQRDDFWTRLRLGSSTVIQGSENCVVRVFTDVSANDPSGIQARRNIEEICRTVHERLKNPQAKGGPSL